MEHLSEAIALIGLCDYDFFRITAAVRWPERPLCFEYDLLELGCELSSVVYNEL